MSRLDRLHRNVAAICGAVCLGSLLTTGCVHAPRTRTAQFWHDEDLQKAAALKENKEKTKLVQVSQDADALAVSAEATADFPHSGNSVAAPRSLQTIPTYRGPAAKTSPAERGADPFGPETVQRLPAHLGGQSKISQSPRPDEPNPGNSDRVGVDGGSQTVTAAPNPTRKTHTTPNGPDRFAGLIDKQLEDVRAVIAGQKPSDGGDALSSEPRRNMLMTTHGERASVDSSNSAAADGVSYAPRWAVVHATPSTTPQAATQNDASGPDPNVSATTAFRTADPANAVGTSAFLPRSVPTGSQGAAVPAEASWPGTAPEAGHVMIQDSDGVWGRFTGDDESAISAAPATKSLHDREGWQAAPEAVDHSSDR
jgi:hypothetical protein